MTTMSATALRNDIYNVIESVNTSSSPVLITNSRGKSAVMISEDDWNSIQETLYINSVPGLGKAIASEINDDVSGCCKESELEW